MHENYIFTSESVSEGHPDKVADQISDSVVDEYLALDPRAKVACETLVGHGAVVGRFDAVRGGYPDARTGKGLSRRDDDGNPA